MAIKKYKPVTPGTRTRVGNAFTEVTTSTPEKSLIAPHRKTGGRNASGRRTMRHMGGGHKRRYRVVDFRRDKHDIPATVASIEYDPNRTAFIALLNYADGEKRYILAPQGLEVGAKVVSGASATPEVGNTMYLSKMPLGSFLHNIELRPGQGGKIVRSAGGSAQLVAREERYSVIKLPSGETRMILNTCLGTIGHVSNADHGQTVLGKAGRKRWLGRRPRTRGVAMNPVDHPMGGGEGRSSGGHPRSRNGQPAKGFKTRDKKKSTNRFIITKRKSKK